MLSVLRPRLRSVVAVWLILHFTGGVSIIRTGFSDDCTCPAGMTPGQTCPMHHAPASTARCRLINAQDVSGLFSSGLPLAGILPEPSVFADALVPLSVIGAASFSLIRQSDTPDPPPPRRI